MTIDWWYAVTYRIKMSRQNIFVPWVRTTMAQTRAFAIIGPSLWNPLPASLCLTLLSGSLSAAISLLKTYFYSQGLHTGSATEGSLPWAALYKFRNTIRYLFLILSVQETWASTWCKCFAPSNNAMCFEAVPYRVVTYDDVFWFGRCFMNRFFCWPVESARRARLQIISSPLTQLISAVAGNRSSENSGKHVCTVCVFSLYLFI